MFRVEHLTWYDFAGRINCGEFHSLAFCCNLTCKSWKPIILLSHFQKTEAEGGEEEEEKEEALKPSPDADTVILFTKPANQGTWYPNDFHSGTSSFHLHIFFYMVCMILIKMTFHSNTSHSIMSSFWFSVQMKFSSWYEISFWYHVNWKQTLFQIENHVALGESGACMSDLAQKACERKHLKLS